MNKTNFKRVLLKISGESLMGVGSYGIDVSTVDRVAKEISQVCKLGVEICLVIGAGNIFRGLSGAAAGMDRASADYMGMLGTVINSLALQSNLKKIEASTKISKIFAMFEPIMLPIIASVAGISLKAANKVITNSGADVPNATIVSPIRIGDNWNFFAIKSEEFIIMSAL